MPSWAIIPEPGDKRSGEKRMQQLLCEIPVMTSQWHTTATLRLVENYMLEHVLLYHWQHSSFVHGEILTTYMKRRLNWIHNEMDKYWYPVDKIWCQSVSHSHDQIFLVEQYDWIQAVKLGWAITRTLVKNWSFSISWGGRLHGDGRLLGQIRYIHVYIHTNTHTHIHTLYLSF